MAGPLAHFLINVSHLAGKHLAFTNYRNKNPSEGIHHCKGITHTTKNT